jgi:DNA-directed RNA polymerase
MEFDKTWTEDVNITAVSPNFTHSLDAAQMREAVRLMKSKPVAAVHDSLGVRAGDYVEAAVAVREAFTRLQGKEILAELAGSVALSGDYNPEEAKASSYFWC